MEGGEEVVLDLRVLVFECVHELFYFLPFGAALFRFGARRHAAGAADEFEPVVARPGDDVVLLDAV